MSNVSYETIKGTVQYHVEETDRYGRKRNMIVFSIKRRACCFLMFLRGQVVLETYTPLPVGFVDEVRLYMSKRKFYQTCREF